MLDLAAYIRAEEAKNQLEDSMDDELFSRLLPDPVSPLPEVDQLLQDDGRLPVMVEDMPASKKRSSSELDEPPTIPKKSRLPALASLVRMQDLVDSGSLSKKQALMTRERLRAGLHGPRGLLKMVGSSTNALERAKKLELMKNAGFSFGEKSRFPRKSHLLIDSMRQFCASS